MGFGRPPLFVLVDRCFLSSRLAYRGWQKNFQEAELFMCFISHLFQLKRSALNENQTKHMSIKVFLLPPGPTKYRIILGGAFLQLEKKERGRDKCFDNIADASQIFQLF